MSIPVLESTNVGSMSFSGCDFQVYCVVPKKFRLSASDPSLLYIGSISTLTLSSRRSLFPVRALGTSSAKHYTRGGRTYAGQLVFSILYKEPMIELANLYVGDDTLPKKGFNIDQVPPFHVLIEGINERGDAVSRIIYGINIGGLSTTYSVEDVFTEESYTYVAEHVSPLVPLGNARDFMENYEVEVSRRTNIDRKQDNPESLVKKSRVINYTKDLNTGILNNQISSDLVF